MRNQENKPLLGFAPSTFETIDTAVFKWLQDEIEVFANYPDGFKKVPVIWSAQERSYQVKQNPELRDKNGKVIFPIISLNKISLRKNINEKGAFQAHIPPVNDERGGSINVVRRIQRNKTQNFANATSVKRHNQINFRLSPKNEKVVYEIISVPMPVHYVIMYNIEINTNYEQEMNEIVQAITNWSGNNNHFTLKYEGHLYDAFIDGDVDQDNNRDNLEDDLRKFKSTISLSGECKNTSEHKTTSNSSSLKKVLIKPLESIIYFLISIPFSLHLLSTVLL